MMIAAGAIFLGVIAVVWSADRFVAGAASASRYFGMPPLLIGMVIVGFGTSAPELVVSALASVEGSTGIALGNAFGSNIVNAALILGITALIRPILVGSSVLRRELPVLLLVTVFSVVLLFDLEMSRLDALLLIAVFALLMLWTLYQGRRREDDALAVQVETGSAVPDMPVRRALFWVVAGLILLIFSSRLLVWGAVEVAMLLGISEMIIGLTIVAVGTSLPELASSIAAARRGEHDIALGNVIGSNLFNTLIVAGLAGLIHPSTVPAQLLWRDMLVMAGLTMLLFVLCYGFGKRQGRITRMEGGILLLLYAGYTVWLFIG